MVDNHSVSIVYVCEWVVKNTLTKTISCVQQVIWVYIYKILSTGLT